MNLNWQRTKIICTLGPATDNPEVLQALIENGLDVARVNMSHGHPAEHAERISRARRTADACGVPLAILVDLPGPKFRVGNLVDQVMEVRRGQELTLASSPVGGPYVPLTYPDLIAGLGVGESVYIADGSVAMDVLSVQADRVECRVWRGGVIRSGAGINFPDSELSTGAPTPKDLEFLQFALQQKAEWVGVSFVQSAADLHRVREHLPAGNSPLLVAKIERKPALAHLDAILQAADAVMVARGDLGIETELEGVPLLQKRIIAKARKIARPVITATQMLESMITHAQPTRAEVADVANAVLDGTSAVMLSAETAIGQYPKEAVKTLSRVVQVTEDAPEEMFSLTYSNTESGSMEEAISLVACRLAREMRAKAIVLPVRRLSEAADVARFRPGAPILAFAATDYLRRQLNMVWGVLPLSGSVECRTRRCVDQAREWLLKTGRAAPGDPIVVLYSSDDSSAASDTLQVVYLP
ncbi:MAG: pyruvate kinase [Candidatus Omnitrophica bacterium]|nr:pyruvate kinase [Candidatus Omnitrophota bacterium]